MQQAAARPWSHIHKHSSPAPPCPALPPPSCLGCPSAELRVQHQALRQAQDEYEAHLNGAAQVLRGGWVPLLMYRRLPAVVGRVGACWLVGHADS